MNYNVRRPHICVVIKTTASCYNPCRYLLTLTKETILFSEGGGEGVSKTTREPQLENIPDYGPCHTEITSAYDSSPWLTPISIS
jgi:hypothetical protein